MLAFDWTISVGNLINVVVLVTGALMFFVNIKSDIKNIKYKVHQLTSEQQAMTEAFKQLGAILTQVAVQDTRIQHVEKQIDELRHGQGFVKAL